MDVSAASPATAVLPALPEGGFEPVAGSMTFDEFLAGLNPLHHLPGIGTIYREATGEHIQPVMRVLGGALLGGPLGMLSSAVMAAIDEFRTAPATPAVPHQVAAGPRYHDDSA